MSKRELLTKHMNTIYSDVTRAISSHGFIVGMFGLVFIVAFASIGQITEVMRATEPLDNGFHAQFIITALQSDSFALVLPILVALPFTTAFVDDIKSGFIKQYLSRTSRKKYIIGKLIACGFSGGLVVFCGILISFLLSFLVFTPMELAFETEQIIVESDGIDVEEESEDQETTDETTSAPTHVIAENIIEEPPSPPRHWESVIKKAVMLSFSGMFWSLVGFVFASLTMNRYMAYASPFILYYVLIILHERYFPSFYVLYPKEWLFHQQEWVLGDFGIIILICILAVIISMCFALFAERRLANV